MTENTAAKANAEKVPFMLPVRCSVCGKAFLTIYPNTIPGTVFATCCNGHKTSYRAGTPDRKAV